METAKRKPLHSAVKKFADDLRGLTSQLNEGVSFLNRATQLKPCAGAREFREAISDLQDEVTELTTEAEHLERFTVDAISFEELLGHCLALYQDNRTSIQRLEAHLAQYGYVAPPSLQREPENPVAAATVAAARWRGGAGSDVEDDEEGADEDVYATARVTATATASRPTTAGKPAASSRSSRQVVMVTPGWAKSKSGGGTASSRRSATPAGRLGKVLPDSDEDEDDDVDVDARGASGNDNNSDSGDDGMELDGGRGGGGRRPATGAAGLGARPTGSMAAGKGQLLAGAQAASWATALTAAAAVRASARKAPRPSVDSRGSATPEAMLMSPSMAQLLAKYNPPSDADPGLAMLPSTGGDAAAAAGAGAGGGGGGGGGGSRGAAGEQAAGARGRDGGSGGGTGVGTGTEELAAAMRGLSPFGRARGAGPAAGALPKEGAPAAQQAQQAQQDRFSGASSSLAAQASGGMGGGTAAAMTGGEDDTCALYHQLIRSRDVTVASLAQPQRPRPAAALQPQAAKAVQAPPPQQQQLQAPPLVVAAVAVPAPAVATIPQHSRFPTARSPTAAAFGAFGLDGGRNAQDASSTTPPPTSGGATVFVPPRSVTPLRSVPRADWQEHDKVLAEKMAGLEMAWVTSGQAGRANTPLRSDLRKSFTAVAEGATGGSGEGGGMAGFAAAMAAARPQSPAPSRAATEAFAASAFMAGERSAAPAGAAWPAHVQPAPAILQQPPQQQPHQALLQRRPVAPINVAGLDDGDMVRVLSPVQKEAPSPRRQPSAATPLGRSGSRLPTPAGSASAAAAASTTVVGATTTPRRDAAAGGSSSSSGLTPKGGAKHAPSNGHGHGAQSRGTPGKRAGSGIGGISTPGRVAHPAASQSMAGARPTTPPGRGLTPERVTRATSATTRTASTTSNAASAAAGAAGSRAGAAAGGVRGTPSSLRKSWNSSLSGLAQAEQAEPERAASGNITPSRIGRGHSATATNASASATASGALGANRTPGRARPVAEARAQPMPTAAAGVQPQVAVPALKIPALAREDTWGSAEDAGDSRTTSAGGAGPHEWRGFAAPAASAAMTSGGGASEFEVMLSMPPVGTPTAKTPGRGEDGAGGMAARTASGIAGGGGGGVPAAVLAGLSPGTSQLVSRALGEGFRPQTAAAGLSSRIPAPAATQRPAIADTRRAAGAATAAAVAAAAALPLPSGGSSSGAAGATAASCGVTLCSEEEWRLLPTRTQAAFPLEVINQYLRSLTAGRPSAGYFSVPDVEALSGDMTTTGAKLLINTLVKLGRCEVAAAAGGVMQYRIKP